MAFTIAACNTRRVKPRAEGRENGGGIRPPFEAQLEVCRLAHSLWGERWLARIVKPESEGRAALERLYADGIRPTEVVGLLVHARFAVGARRLSPNGARRAAVGLRAFRAVLEAVEQAPPCQVTFKAMAGDEERGAITWSLSQYVGDWVPQYLDAAADGIVKTPLIVKGRQADRGLRRCAQRLLKLIQERTGRLSYADVGALLHAAFPKRFHRGAADGDDHEDAVRDLIRRARGKR
jgi:hypothetical protein